MDVGLEPAYRFKLFGRRVGVSLPLVLGGSPDGYYVDSDGDDETIGYFSGSLKCSVGTALSRQIRRLVPQRLGDLPEPAGGQRRER